MCVVEEWFFTSLATSGPVLGVQRVYFLDSGVGFSVNLEGERLGKQLAGIKLQHCPRCKWSIMIRAAQHFSIDGRAISHVFWYKLINEIFCSGASKMASRQVCKTCKDISRYASIVFEQP